MDTDTRLRLEKFFTTFDITEFGDPVAGVNTMAAICGVLAGVSRAGSGIRTFQDRHLRIGTSFLVSGSASVGRVVDEVLLEVGLRQNHFARHLHRDLQWTEHLKRNFAKRTVDGALLESESDIPCSELPGLGEHLYGPPMDEWKRVLAKPPMEGNQHGTTSPKFFVAATRPKDLEMRLSDLHSGRPLVHLGVSRPSDLAGFGEIVGALLDGCHAVGTCGETLHGQVMITDPLKMLDEAARLPDEGMSWVGRLVWLCDNDAGPEVPMDPSLKKADPTESLTERFREALGKGLAKRLGGDTMEPQIIKADLGKAQYRWTNFLNEMEKCLPGISGAARNLLSTLTFGLIELAGCAGRKPLDLKVNDAEAFARFLVHRMANARATILYAEKVTRRQSQIRRVFQKLGDMPIDARKVYRLLNLKSDDCYECLKWLEATNLAFQSDSGWKRVEGAQLSFNTHPILTLEV
jgi:hypothetical protein